jgi:hypothetical protein
MHHVVVVFFHFDETTADFTFSLNYILSKKSKGQTLFWQPSRSDTKGKKNLRTF